MLCTFTLIFNVFPVIARVKVSGQNQKSGKWRFHRRQNGLYLSDKKKTLSFNTAFDTVFSNNVSSSPSLSAICSEIQHPQVSCDFITSHQIFAHLPSQINLLLCFHYLYQNEHHIFMFVVVCCALEKVQIVKRSNKIRTNKTQGYYENTTCAPRLLRKYLLIIYSIKKIKYIINFSLIFSHFQNISQSRSMWLITTFTSCTGTP